MNRFAYALFAALLAVAGCTDSRRSNDDDDAGPPGSCGNGTREGSEVCDGSDLGAQSCDSLGLGGGTLACAADCSRLDASGCESSCTPTCAGVECGPDPACPIASCGSCSGGATCSGGQCMGGDPNAPTILMLSTNTMVLGEGQSLVVTAVVTDPDGVEDVIGGTLESPLGGSYGAFAASGSGSYSMTLTLSALDAVEAIATPPGGAPRTLRARFYDAGGLEATRDVMIRIACTVTTEGMCGTSCRDLESDFANCGACGNSCESASGEGGDCYSGTCASFHYRREGDASCAAVCTRDGARCDDGITFGPDWGACNGYPGCVGERGLTCSQTFGIDDVEAICLCAD